jgi:hypothetical protein
MIRFIIANGLDDELRRHDWAGFARGYNGSGQVAKYAGLLAAAFAKWARIPDTPYPPIPATGSGVKPAPSPLVKVEVAPIIPPAEPVPFSATASAPPQPGFWASVIAAWRAYRNGEI